MLRIMINIMPTSIIHVFANNRIFVRVLYKMRMILYLKFDYLDLLIVRGLKNIDEHDKAISVVKKHKGELKFCNLLINTDVGMAKSIIKGYPTELDFCKLLINSDRDMAKSIIIDHKDDIEYCRLLERLERYNALGDSPNERRLNFSTEKYHHLLQVSEDLIQQFPDDFLLHDRLANNYLGGGYQDKARYHFFISLILQRKQKLLEGKTGLIFISGLHRGGCGFTHRSLMNGLGIKDIKDSLIRYYDGYYPDYGIIDLPDYVVGSKFSPMPDGIVTTHAGALEPNLKNLALITDRLIVHLRDPRQAFISKIYYSEYLRYSGNISGLMEYRYPDGFFQWPFAKKVDWQIDNYYFPADIKWIQGWLKAEEDLEFLCNIHWSRFEVLAKDPKRFFQEILFFYGIDENRFVYPQKPEFQNMSHMRKGSTDEWMQVLSKDQIEKMNRQIPEVWFEKFGWPKI